MHLLCFFAANPDRVLTRQELVEELWPDVIVNENSLTRAISELRKRLATAHKKSASIIETIPKKGYRLTAIIASPEQSVPSAQVTAPSNGNRQLLPARQYGFGGYSVKQISLLSTVCFSLLLSLWLWQSSPLPSADGRLIPVATTQLVDEVISNDESWIGAEITLSNSTGSRNSADLEQSIVVSNDRSKLAYIVHNSNSSTVFVASVASLTMAYPVFTSSEKLSNLRWSPIGEALLFASRPKLATTALFSSNRDPAKLIFVDVNTLTVKELLSEDLEPDSNETLNLT